jgi:hypothetical protein
VVTVGVGARALEGGKATLRAGVPQAVATARA